MVEKRDCSFCGSTIEPGTGLLFIKRDGTRYTFCSSKCRRNLLELKRVPRTVKWTKHYIKGLGKAAAMEKKGISKKAVAPAKKEAATVAPVAGGQGGSTPAPEPGKGSAPAKKPAPAKKE